MSSVLTYRAPLLSAILAVTTNGQLLLYVHISQQLLKKILKSEKKILTNHKNTAIMLSIRSTGFNTCSWNVRYFLQCLQNGNLHSMALSNQQVAKTSPSSAKFAQHSKEIKEMEEENEVLYDELSKLTLDHKKALEKMKSLEQQLQQASMGHGDNLRNQEFEEEFEDMKGYLQAEKDKRTKAEAEIDVLKARFVSGRGSVTEDDTEVDSNWGDSDDDLFDLPGVHGSPVKVKPAKRMDMAHKVNGENTGLVAILRSQIVSLRQENDELKRKSTETLLRNLTTAE